MNTPLLVAAVCAGRPGCTVQDPGSPTSPDTAVFATACRVEDNAHDNSQRASSALPARASTRPEPQLGTVAPSTRVPSHVVTPSMRAMERASAAQAGNMTDVDKKAQKNCADAGAPDAPRQGTTRPAAT